MRHTLRKMAWLTIATFVLVSAAAWAQGGGTYSEADRARFEQQAQKRAEILRRNEEAEEKKKAEAAARARQANEANRAYRERLRREAHSQPNCPPGRPHPGVFGPQPYYNPWGFPPNPWFNGPQLNVPVAPRVAAPQPEPRPRTAPTHIVNYRGLELQQMRSGLETFAAANSVGGQLYLAQDHQKYLVRYAGTPRFIDNRAIVPVYARPAQGGPEQLTTLVVEFDELDYTVSEWELKRAQGWWQQNRVTYL